MTDGSPKQQNKKFKLPNPQIMGENRSMMASGPNGGTPMVSKPGKASVNHYVCFSNGIKIKEEDFSELNPKFVPQNLIEEKIRMELKGVDQEHIQAFVDDVKVQFQTNLDPRVKRQSVDQNAGRPASGGQVGGRKMSDSTLTKRKQSEIISKAGSNALFAPTQRQGVSPVFKRTTRSQLEHLEAFESRTKINKHYNIRDEIIMKKPLCFVSICPPEHELRGLYEGDLCSKSQGQVCRHSNQRVISRLDKIKEIIELHKVQAAKNLTLQRDGLNQSSSPGLTAASMHQSPSGKGLASPSAFSGAIGEGRSSPTDSPGLRSNKGSQDLSQVTAAPKHGSAFEDQINMLNKGDRLRQEREEQLLQHHLKNMQEDRKNQILEAAIQLKSAFTNQDEKRDSRIIDPVEAKLLADSYKILHQEEQRFKSVFIQSAEKNFQSMQPVEKVKARTRETLFDHQVKYHSPCDAQFDSINKMPPICSKYAKKDRNFSIGLFSDRNDKAIINEEYSGGTYYATGLQAIKGQIKGNIKMNCQTDRPSIFGKGDRHGDGEANYNDREQVEGYDKTAFLRNQKNQGDNWANMAKSKGRDNTMYHLSDGYNLNKKKSGNHFDNLVKLQSPSALRCQPVYYDYSKDKKKQASSKKGSVMHIQSQLSNNGDLNTIASMQEIQSQEGGTTAMIQESDHHSQQDAQNSIQNVMDGLGRTGLFSNTMTSQLMGIKDYGSMTLEEKILNASFAPKLHPTPI